MRILGIDPGYGLIGFSIIEKTRADNQVIDYGVIETPKDMIFFERLKVIYDSMNKLIDKYNPNEMAIEKLYFNKNITTGIPVAEARGVILLSAVNRGLPVYEYTPQQIKMALTGVGKAEKSQVQFMVKTLLHLTKVPRPDDAADAVAVALCHSQTNQAMLGMRF